MSSDMPPKAVAAIELIRRTGATSFQLRYSDDEHPTVWIAVAEFETPGPPPAGGQVRAEVGAALNPERAILRLAEDLVDGGQCTHCGRPAGLDPDSLDAMPLGQVVCWYQYDPELATFRRACEGNG